METYSEVKYEGNIYRRKDKDDPDEVRGYYRHAGEPLWLVLVPEVYNDLPKELQDFLDGKKMAHEYDMYPRDEQVGGDHYKKLNPEPIDLIRRWFTPEEYAGYLRGNIIKYLARYKEKGGVQDLEKAQQYLGWLIDLEKGNEH